MSSPAWSIARPYYARRGGADLDAMLAQSPSSSGRARRSAHGMWTTTMTSKLPQAVSSAEFLALHGAPASSYMPFYLEANTFFETPVCKIQFTLRALERSWSNPLWIRQETVDVLRLMAAPLEAPLGLWLPQCGDSFRPLGSLPPKVQHIILRDAPITSFVQEGSHTLLALDYVRTLTELGGAAGISQNVRPLKPVSMARPRYVWQGATPQFVNLFDRAWAAFEPALARHHLTIEGSRSSTREVPPVHPRKKMWVSMRCAASMHVEAFRSFFMVPTDAITVATPHHGGLFFNAAQLFPTQLLHQKTVDVMTRIADIERKQGIDHVPDESMGSHGPKIIHAIPHSLESENSSQPTQSSSINSPTALSSNSRFVDHFSDYQLHGPQGTDMVPGDSGDATNTVSCELDAMMLFADDFDVTPEETEARDVPGLSSSMPDEAADDDGVHNRLMMSAEEELVAEIECWEATTVVVDTAAVHDGDSPLSYPAELEIVHELMDQGCCFGAPLEVESDASDQKGEDLFADSENELPTESPASFAAHETAAATPTVAHVSFAVSPVSVVGCQYHADASVITHPVEFDQLLGNDATAITPTPTPFQCGGAA